MAFEKEREPQQVNAEDAQRTKASTEVDTQTAKQLLEEERARCDRFVYLVSHELRGPLANVMGYSQLLSREALSEETKARAAESLLRNAKRLNSMIESLLQASRVARGQVVLERKPIDILQIVERVVEEQRALAPLRDVELHSPAGPIIGHWDQAILSLVIGNVVNNALKFSEADTRVIVDIRHAGGCVEIAVTDFGPGIAASELPHVFEPYRARAGSGKPGLGVGLYVAKGLVEAHGGKIGLKSAPGAGSTFVVSLPLNTLSDRST